MEWKEEAVNNCAPKNGPATERSSARVEWGYFDTNVNIFNETLPHSQVIEPGTPSYDLDFTTEANLKFVAIKEPISQPVKTNWYINPLNSGPIPDSVFEAPIEHNGCRYYVSRIIVSLPETQTNIKLYV